jgi:cytochrome P450
MRAPLPDVAAGLAFRRDPLGFLQARDDGGDLIRFRAGPTDYTVVKRPETIQQVLVRDAALYGEGKWTLRGRRVMRDCLITRDGDAHLARRALLRPAFERRRIAARAPAIVERAARLAASWEERRVIDVRVEMSQVALTATADALFSLELEPVAAELVRALATMLHEVPRLGMPWRWPRGLVRARARLDRAVRPAIAQRRRQGGDEDDALSALLKARDAHGRRLDDAQVAAEVVSLLMAAVDTTPGTLAWTWLALARHPDIEARIHAELAAVLRGRLPAAADLPRLAELDRAIAEVLRLHPPVHFIDRRSRADSQLDGHTLPARSFLLLSPLLTQRDPRYYPEPGAFRPERWTSPERSLRPRFAYFPFGAGPHACIGMSLARLELALVVATIASDWRLRPARGLDDEPSPQTMRFPMTGERR